MTVRQKLPPMTMREVDACDLGYRRVFADGYNVASWRAGPVNSAIPPSQVHVLIPVTDDVRVVLRLKSARALDELVGVLLAHRRDVWGETDEPGPSPG